MPLTLGSVTSEADQTRSFSRRALLLGAVQVGVASLLIGRLGYLAIRESDRYKLLAEDNRISVRLIPPRRAIILDRYGEELAVNRPEYSISLLRERASDISATLDRLETFYPLPAGERARILEDAARLPSFVPLDIARDVDWQVFSAAQVRLPELPGIQAEQGFTRAYTDGFALAHVLGYVGAPTPEQAKAAADPVYYIPGFKVGKGGLEETLEARLQGEAGAAKVEVNAHGRVIRSLERQSDVVPPPLTLTLDRQLQLYTANRLQAESASAVVMDVQRGEILALVSVPAFDPNSFSGGISTTEWTALTGNNRNPLLNKPLQGQYPPGSTFKMATALAALEAGIDPEEAVYCRGYYNLGRFRFHCWKRSGHGRVNMASGIYSSCDCYFYDVGRRIGPDAIARMARKLGLGEKYDLPLPSQRSGLVPDIAWKRKRYDAAWLPGESLNYAIGQGYLLTTPLQLAVMTARLASGRRITPRLIRAEGDAQPEPLDIDPDHLTFVRTAMYAVVNAGGGTARRAQLGLEGIELAGKTGTAQVRRITAEERRRGVTRNEDLPWERRDHALFVAFAPADAPRYACSVIIDHGGSGSATASPVARDIIRHLFELEQQRAGDQGLALGGQAAPDAQMAL